MKGNLYKTKIWLIYGLTFLSSSIGISQNVQEILTPEFASSSLTTSDSLLLEDLSDRASAHDYEDPMEAMPIIDSLIATSIRLKSGLFLSQAMLSKSSVYDYLQIADSIRYYNDQSLFIDEYIGDDESWIWGKIAEAFWHLDYGEMDSCIMGFNHLLEHTRLDSAYVYRADIYTNLGIAHEMKGEPISALKNYQNSIDIIESQSEDFFGINEPYIHVGQLFHDIANTEKAIEHFEKSLEFHHKYNSEKILVANLYESLGNLYLEEGEINTAKNYFLKANEIGIDYAELDFLIVGSLLGLAKVEIELESKKALPLLDDVIEKASRTLEREGECTAHTLKGGVYLKSKNYKAALNSCSMAQNLAIDSVDIRLLKDVYKCLFQAHKGMGQFEKALNFKEKESKLERTILNEDQVRDFTRVDLEYHFQKEKLQDSISTALDIAILEKDKRILTANNRNIIFGLGGTAMIALLTLLGFFRLKKQNEIITDQKKSLEDLNSIKDQIFAIIGHDLRKPALAFNGLSRKVNYLLQKKDYDGLDKLGEQIESNGFSLQKIIDNLLNWALAQRSVVPYNPEAVDLYALSEELVLSVRPRLDSKNITFVNNISIGQKVWSDRTSLYTVLLNLIDNAIKYTRDGGRVTLDATLDNGQLKITVQDEGEGMDEQQINNLFLLSKDKSKRGTQGEKGTGLGLHIANELVKINKGIIEVTSQLGQGSRFDVILPIVA